MADKAKFQMADGSYPINTCADVSDAAKLAHHSKTYSFAQVKAHVLRAKSALNCPDSALPDSWSEGQSSLPEGQMSEIERRYTLVPVELRASADRRTIGGYAAKFNTYSRDLGRFTETIHPGFFNKSRGDGWPEVICRYNHDDNLLLGTIGGGTLRLQVDEIGLSYEVDPPAARQDIIELVDRGDVRKSSFAFRVLDDDWGMNQEGITTRQLISGQLIDVAPVNVPAYIDTSVALRSLAVKMNADVEEIRSLEREGELRKLFIRTDGKQPTAKRLSGAEALVALKSRPDPLEGEYS